MEIVPAEIMLSISKRLSDHASPMLPVISCDSIPLPLASDYTTGIREHGR